MACLLAGERQKKERAKFDPLFLVMLWLEVMGGKA